MQSAKTAAVDASADVVVDVVSDVVCPWCYIGKRKLESAISRLRAREPEVQVAVRWHPFQLNPDLPTTGMDRGAYLRAKFGSQTHYREIYARVKRAGTQVGIAFDFDRIVTQPNTLDAHTLTAWAQQRGDPAAVDSVVEALFRAFFVDGRTLSDRSELARIAGETGLAITAADALSTAFDLRATVEAEDREARSVGIRSVPFFIFNGKTAVAGAQDPETLLQAVAAARATDQASDESMGHPRPIQ